MTDPQEAETRALKSGIRVDRIRVSNFRSLKNIEVELADTCVLVGMNNSGKTSFLKALHLALGADRRLVSMDDFHVPPNGTATTEITIDVRIIAVNAEGTREDNFEQKWSDHDLGGVISIDEEDRDVVAIRTIITQDTMSNEIKINRFSLNEWPEFEDWTHNGLGKKCGRFEQIASFFMDAQRDIVGDLRTRTSPVGRLLSKIELPSEAVAELEERLKSLNEDIVASSEVLSHVKNILSQLNRTVPAFGDGVEITPISKKIRDITKGLGIDFRDAEGSSFALDYHGMGTRSWASLLSFEAYISWMASLAGRKNKPFHPILALEEPESHLHPNAQRTVYGQLSHGYGQRILSTHSPYIAGQAGLGEILHFYKEGSETRVNKLPLVDLDPEDIRKINREIMRSRGELLFSRAVVLFEGETEEQALPLFAKRLWQSSPFEMGVAFVGVGGDKNYLPFIRTLQSLKIPWYIFSDGEPNAIQAVDNALGRLNLARPQDNIFVIPNGEAIENYLISSGYQEEVRDAVFQHQAPYANERHAEARRREFAAWGDQELLAHLKSNKTSMAAHWASEICKLTGARSVPDLIRQLLTKIAQDLNPRNGGTI